jgi:hypothetical protein
MENENELDYNTLEVDKADETVYYNDKLHKYWTRKSHQSCISVTTLIHNYTVFDEDFWSSYKAIESLADPETFLGIKSLLLDSKKFNEGYLDMTNISKEDFLERKQEVLDEWAEKREASCLRGSAIHKNLELGHLAGDTKELQYLGLGGVFNTNTTNQIAPGVQAVYPELLLSRISPDGELRIAGQADLIIIDGFDVYILDYKGLDLNTPILTTQGFKLLKDINKDDIIFDKDGKETRIKNISEIHNNPCYKIIFDSGEEIIADHEHRWLISFRKGTGKYQEKVLTTEELKESLDLYKEKKNAYYLPKIINTKPLDRKDVDLPIDPYILGYWLGDGTSVAGSITAENENFWKEVENRGYKYGEDISGINRTELRTIFGLRTQLNNLNLINNKHIPNCYLLASYNQRLELLRGFMDADGYYNSKRKRFVMATTREYQADYLVTLLATLGVKPSKIYAKKYCNDKEFDGWDVCFTMKDNPFLIRNQDNIECPKTDKSSFRVIKSVELIDTVPTKCLEVDSPSHTFLIGYSLMPTHNTNKEIKMKSYFDRKTKRSQMMVYPLNNLEDTNFWHYTLQLSTYAWMIEKIDPRFKIKSLTLIHYDHDGNVTTYDCEYRKKDVERMLAHYKQKLKHDEFKKSRQKIIF